MTRLERLFEAILREKYLRKMSIVNLQNFAFAFESRVINAVKTKVNLNDDVLNDFIRRIVIANHNRMIKSPFAVVDENQ